VYQISGQSDNEFAFYDNFFLFDEKKKNKQKKRQEKKMKKLSQFSKVPILETLGVIECEVMMLANISITKISGFC